MAAPTPKKPEEKQKCCSTSTEKVGKVGNFINEEKSIKVSCEN